MAVNRNATHTSLNVRVKYYDHAYIDNDTSLIPTLKVKGIFYARKQTNVKNEVYITQAGQKTTQQRMTLYTDDLVKDLEPDDFILFNGEKWIVQATEEVIQSKFRGKKAWSGTDIYLRK